MLAKFNYYLLILCRCDERGLSRKYIIECVKASLERLQLEYIDIVIIHRADSTCPMEGNSMLQKNRYTLYLEMA